MRSIKFNKKGIATLLFVLFTSVMFSGVIHASSPPPQYTLKGYIRDAITSKPIPYAHYEIDTLDGAIVYYKCADENGYFYVDLFSGSYIITIFAKGYYNYTGEITISNDMQLTFYLQPKNPPPQFFVSGYVRDNKTGEGINNATVIIGPKITHTNSMGYYLIQIPKGTYTLSVQAEGYKFYDTTIVVSGNIRKDIILEPEHTNILSSGTSGWVYVLIFLLLIAIIIGVIIGVVKRKKNKNLPPPPAWESEEKPESIEETIEEKTPPSEVAKESEVKYCPNCGHEIDPEWKICPYCGHKLKE